MGDLEAWLGAGEAARLDPADLADLEVAVEAVLAGGREVARRYRAHGPVEVEEKAPDDPVTEADRAADRAIGRVLRRLRPGEAVRSEEALASAPGADASGAPEATPGPEAADQEVAGAGHLWVVDPLDGTKEFLARNGEFTVMVGLAVAGGARVGAVYQPDPGVLYLGCSGGGAWRARLRHDRRGAPGREASPGRDGGAGEGGGGGDDGGDAGAEGEAEVRGLEDFRTPVPLRITGRRQGPVRVLHSRSHRPDGLERLGQRLGEVELVPSGSAGLKCARLAADEGDLYVHPVPYLKEWDTCAPEALLRGAGGRVTDCLGRPLRYGKEDLAQPAGLFAARPDVWERAAEVAEELAPSGGAS